MAENMQKKPGRPNGPNGKKENEKSNMVRSLLFTFILICFAALLIANMNQGGTEKTEVPISEVIQRANDPEGDIAKITVSGNTLDITVKGQDKATETSRKDGSGTLYDQGLINHCEGLDGDALKEYEGKYPVIEYKEDFDVWGVVFNVALTILPIVAIIIFFSF